MTPLEKIIGEIIAAEGPMPIDRYMGLCLGHPVHGYYMSRDPIGEQGDFMTAPEISQIFGELIGVWCAAAWDAMGKPAHFNLVELGPGRGTLMADILKAAKVMPGFREAARIHLVEMSPILRKVQKEKLGADAIWHSSFSNVPYDPMILIANEFFDAIPIRQLEKRDGKWLERCVGTRGLCLVPIGYDPTVGKDGDILEYSFQRQEIGVEIGTRFMGHPGAAIVIDYGHLQTAPGDTLQAVRNHKYVPITDRPGESDITSHVNFEAMAFALGRSGAKVHLAVTQRAFLLAMGLEQRAAILSAKADAKTREILARAVLRLAGEAEMGNLFKVMVATSPGMATPYPFGKI
jgi:NADH dehydrogenase [ubiquinone] 1 alpha subcomplex assembly factor 7